MTPLVVCYPNGEYARYEGRTRTHKVRSLDGPMSKEYVEIFRTKPNELFTQNDPGEPVA
jgi:hypothetical protein